MNVNIVLDVVSPICPNIILDVVSPRCPARYHGITSDRKLSSEAVAAKKMRRHQERRWKKSQSDMDRLIYQKACTKAKY